MSRLRVVHRTGPVFALFQPRYQPIGDSVFLL
jgi:hypothetical protein